MVQRSDWGQVLSVWADGLVSLIVECQLRAARPDSAVLERGSTCRFKGHTAEQIGDEGAKRCQIFSNFEELKMRDSDG